ADGDVEGGLGPGSRPSSSHKLAGQLQDVRMGRSVEPEAEGFQASEVGGNPLDRSILLGFEKQAQCARQGKAQSLGESPGESVIQNDERPFELQGKGEDLAFSGA